MPRKNIRLLRGQPLIAWTIAAALAAESLDRVVVSTEDEEIAQIARGLGADVPFLRPSGLAGDEATTLSVLSHVISELEALEGYRCDAVMTLQPTSPLRKTAHIDEAAALFASDPQADSLVSCIPVPHIFHPRSVMKLDDQGYLVPYLSDTQPTRRQDKETVFARNGAAIYITRRSCLDRFVFGGRLLAYMMDEHYSIDIDTVVDFERAEAMMAQTA